MKEAIIKYKDSKTLEVLNSLARYFDFSISIFEKKKSEKKQYDYINGIPVKKGNSSISIKELNTIFTGKNLDAKKLRAEAWQRQK